MYTPLLAGDDHWTPKMQNLMSEFQKGLGSILRRQHGGVGGGNDGGSPQSDEGLASILTPIDEVQYWADMANTAGRRDLRQMAAAFHSCLEPLTGEVARLETLAQLQVSETFKFHLGACPEKMSFLLKT